MDLPYVLGFIAIPSPPSVTLRLFFSTLEGDALGHFIVALGTSVSTTQSCGRGVYPDELTLSVALTNG